MELRKKASPYKREIFLAAGIIAFYFLFRLINLTLLPVFVDEAIYIRWSQVMRAEPTLRFLPLSDGKQPLFMWLTIPFLKIFSDPLFAGRLESVLVGFLTMIGVGILTFLLFKSRKKALLASFLMAICPFAVFFDRMALTDSMLAMSGVWIFILGVLLGQYLRLDLAMIAGITLGLALLTKSPAAVFAVFLAITSILFLRNCAGKWLKMIFLLAVGYGTALSIYNILRLGPNFHMIGIRNSDYVYSLTEVFRHPHDPFWSHFRAGLDFFNKLLTTPVFLSAIAGIVFIISKRFRKEIALLMLWGIAPVLLQNFIAKVFTSRYVLFSVPYFLILASHFWIEKADSFLRKKAFFPFRRLFPLVGIFILTFFSLRFDYLLLTNPAAANLPAGDRQGYLEEWSAGQGIFETARFFKQKAKSGKVLVGTEGFFGTLPDGLQIYVEGEKNITVIGVGLQLRKVPEKLLNATLDNKVYLLINDSRNNLTGDSRAVLLQKYPKAVKTDGTRESLLLYEIKS